MPTTIYKSGGWPEPPPLRSHPLLHATRKVRWICGVGGGGGGWCLGVRQIFTSEVGIEWNKKVLKDDCGEFKKEKLGGGMAGLI